MSVVVTRAEVMENIKNRIIENINSGLLLDGQARYVIERSDCYNRTIAIKLGEEIAKLYRKEGYDVDACEYGASSRENYIAINVSL